MREKREYVRANVLLVVGYKVLRRPEMTGKALSDNLSASGIRLFLPHQLEPGTDLELEINIPDEKPIPVLGKVVSQKSLTSFDKKPGTYLKTGINFTKIDSLDRDKITRYTSKVISMKE